MKIHKKYGEFLDDAIRYWEDRAIISSDEANKLRNSYEVISFDWNNFLDLAKGLIVESLQSKPFK